MNNERREGCRASGREFRADILPAWSPTWKKRWNWTWELDLLSNEEQANRYFESEGIKRNGPKQYLDYCDYEADSIHSKMSDAHPVYSDDRSFDSAADYMSDF